MKREKNIFLILLPHSIVLLQVPWLLIVPKLERLNFKDEAFPADSTNEEVKKPFLLLLMKNKNFSCLFQRLDLSFI